MKYKKLVILLFLFILIFPSQSLAALPSGARDNMDSTFKNTSGYQWNFSDNYPTLKYTINHPSFYAEDFMYEMNWYTSVNGNRLSKWMILMRPRENGHLSRTFIHPNDASWWAGQLNGNSSYVQNMGNSHSVYIDNNATHPSGYRIYSRDLAKWSGATIKAVGTGMFDGPPNSGNRHEMGEVAFTTTSYPTGSMSAPSSVAAGDSVTVSFSGREYYPSSFHGTSARIYYTLKLNGSVIDSGTKSSTSLSDSYTLSSGICTSGTNTFELLVSDQVERTKTITKSISVSGDCTTDSGTTTEPTTTEPTTTEPAPEPTNDPPVAKFTHSPTTIYNDTNVSFTNGSTDPNGDPLTYRWQYQRPGSTTWYTFSYSKHPSRTFTTKGTWNIRLRVSDGEYSDTVTRPLTVKNRAPVANFTHSPTYIYNDTTVSFDNNSTDRDGDSLTYRWAYQAPNSTTWTTFSYSTNPSRIFNKKGTWNIRLVASDGTATDSVTGTITVRNRAPVANFTHSPTTIYNDTTVSFDNNSTDRDGDSLTYRWSYQAPNSTTWTTFSYTTHPSRIFNKKGTWSIRLVASDGTTTDSVTRTLTVINRAPTVTLTYSPSTLYEGDTVTLKAVPVDRDGDLMSVEFQRYVNGSWQRLQRTTSVSSYTSVTHQRIVAPESYIIRAYVTDTSGATGQDSVSFTPSPLLISAQVNHTPDWQAMHEAAGHPSDQFYAGERFLTEALVTDHDIRQVTVTFTGNQINGNTLTIVKAMDGQSHPTYLAEIYDEVMGDPAEHLEDGPVQFVFVAEWQNGVVKQDIVNVNIVSDVYGAFDFYRSN